MAIALDAATPHKSSADVSATSFSHACTGSDLSLVLVIGWLDTSRSSGPTVSSVTYNGVALTFRARAQQLFAGNAQALTCEVWTLDNPATGSNTVAITISETGGAGREIYAAALSYTGANNGVGSTVGTATGSSTTPSVTFTTEAAGSWIVGGTPHTSEDKNATPGTDVNERTDYTTGVWAADKAATGGSDTFNCSYSIGDRWSLAAVELKAASWGGGATVKRLAALGVG
jgi:hypothetical protein